MQDVELRQGAQGESSPGLSPPANNWTATLATSWAEQVGRRAGGPQPGQTIPVRGCRPGLPQLAWSAWPVKLVLTVAAEAVLMTELPSQI